MRKSNTQKISDVISEYIGQLKIGRKLGEARIIKSWPLVVGPVIARQTEKVYLRNGVFYIHLKSPALRNELSYMTTRIMDVLNEQVGEKIITRVVIR